MTFFLLIFCCILWILGAKFIDVFKITGGYFLGMGLVGLLWCLAIYYFTIRPFLNLVS